MMECFRIDESGYTGGDLLNPDQPFQGATAVSITDEDASFLIKKHFPRLQASELKYRALARRPNNFQRLLDLQRDVLSNYRCVTYICDKRFLLLLMFLDYAVEPFYYENGIDFYEDGHNYALASLLYSVGPALLGKEEFEALLIAFQHAVRDKTAESLHALVEAARKTNWKKLPEAISPLAKYESKECLSAIATSGVSTDAAFVVLQSLLSRMEAMADGPYRVEHDQSNNLSNYNKLLHRFIAFDQQSEFHMTEITSMKFPLKLTSVTQVDSKFSPAVQLADVVIGLAIDATKRLVGLNPKGADPQLVMSSYSDDQIIHLLPSINFEEQHKFRQGTQASDAIDFFARNFIG